LYSLGEYICLLLIVYLKISLIYTCNRLFIHLSQHYNANFHAKNIIFIKVYNKLYSLFKLNYNWRHCSALSLTVVILCVWIKRAYVCDNKLVCKAFRLTFSCQTSPISLPFIFILWLKPSSFQSMYCRSLQFLQYAP